MANYHFGRLTNLSEKETIVCKKLLLDDIPGYRISRQTVGRTDGRMDGQTQRKRREERKNEIFGEWSYLDEPSIEIEMANRYLFVRFK